jgi:uncharacterized protein DUF5908
MTIEINQLKIISKVVNTNEKSIANNSLKGNTINADVKEEIINECLSRFKKYLERIEEV